MSRILDFEEKKAHLISLEELKSSAKEVLPGSKYQNEIWHADLFVKINMILQKIGLNSECTGITVASGGVKKFPGVSSEESRKLQYGDKTIPSYTFRRLMANFALTDFVTSETILNLVVIYHQQGIQIGLGPNVKACSNMSILSSDFTMSSYGGNKMPGYEKMLEAMSTWLHNSQYIHDRNNEIIAQMKDVHVKRKEVCEIIGDMTMKRVQRDTIGSAAGNIPLNQSQITKFTSAYLEVQNQKDLSLWDLYNIGTNLHKADDMDMASIMDQNHVFGEMLMDYYKINNNFNLNEEATVIDVIHEDVTESVNPVKKEITNSTSFDDGDW